MTKGVFKNCTTCKKDKNCCSNFDLIDNPILNKFEYKNLTNNLNINKDNFLYVRNGCYNIITPNGICPFYQNKCTIYENRPNDCKLFPFDIKFINKKYYLVLYKLDCFNHNEMLKENVDDIINEIKPYIKTYTNKKLNSKLKALDYTIIKEIDILLPVKIIDK